MRLMSCLVIGFEQEGEAVASRDLSREDRQIQYALRMIEKMEKKEKERAKMTPTSGGKDGDRGDKDQGPIHLKRDRQTSPRPEPSLPQLDGASEDFLRLEKRGRAEPISRAKMTAFEASHIKKLQVT